MSKKSVLKGQIKNRVQLFNPRTKKWVKIDSRTGRIIAQKSDSKPYKNVIKYKEKTEENSNTLGVWKMNSRLKEKQEKIVAFIAIGILIALLILLLLAIALSISLLQSGVIPKGTISLVIGICGFLFFSLVTGRLFQKYISLKEVYKWIKKYMKDT